jgi:hypothetical protein
VGSPPHGASSKEKSEEVPHRTRGVCCWISAGVSWMGLEGGQKIEDEEMVVGEEEEVEDREGGGVDNGGTGETSASAAASARGLTLLLRYDLSRLRCPSAVSPVILIVRPKCRMTAVSSAPFTLLASAGVSVLKLRCGRLWEEDGVGEDGDEEDDVNGTVMLTMAMWMFLGMVMNQVQMAPRHCLQPDLCQKPVSRGTT